MTFLKSGLAGVSLLEADEVENYLLQHRIRGRAWEDAEAWRFQRRLGADEDDAAAVPELFETRDVDTLRRSVAGRLVPLIEKVRGTTPATVRELASEMFRVFERFGVRETLGRWIEAASAAGDLEQRGEHEQVWAELVNLFEQMVDLLGEEPVSPADFVDVLEAGLERFDLALTPPTVDQVLVGQVDRTRTPTVRAALVLGLNEGCFPLVARDTSILSRAERGELRRRKIDLDPDPLRRRLDERFLGYLAFTRASERLIVSRPRVDESGREQQPSSFWEELRRLVPASQPTVLPRETGTDVRHISTPRQLVTCLMEWSNDRPTPATRDAGMPDVGATPASPDADRRNDPGPVRATPASPVASDDTNLPISAVGATPASPGPGIESALLGATPASPVAAPDAPITATNPHDPRPALYQWLATQPCAGGAVDGMRYLAWKALSYRNQPALSQRWARELFPTPLRTSAGQLETQAACPFRHFLKYGLRLAGRERTT